MGPASNPVGRGGGLILRSGSRFGEAPGLTLGAEGIRFRPRGGGTGGGTELGFDFLGSAGLLNASWAGLSSPMASFLGDCGDSTVIKSGELGEDRELSEADLFMGLDPRKLEALEGSFPLAL